MSRAFLSFQLVLNTVNNPSRNTGKWKLHIQKQGQTHYNKNLYGGGQKSLTEAVFATASKQRSWLIVALTDIVAKTTSVNQIKNKKARRAHRPLPPLDPALP
jgi:hypothetical protein